MLVNFSKISDRSNRLSFKAAKEIRKAYIRKAFKLIINSTSQTLINTLKN